MGPKLGLRAAFFALGIIAPFLLGAPAQAAGAGGWYAINLSVPRVFGVLLEDGRVFLSGNGAAPNAASIFDPANRGITETRVGNGDYRAAIPVRVPDGRVLLVGPPRYPRLSWPSVVAELYDPRSDTWSAAASFAHFPTLGSYTATLLNDGRLLVAGGETEGGSTAGAEIYEPGNNRWIAVGSLPDGRVGQTATLLGDGRVLTVGGQEEYGTAPVASAFVFFPTTNTWRSIALMSIPRSKHAAVRLPDGRVLVVGGADSSNHPLRLAEVFDPRTDSWKPARSMAVARAYPGAQLLADGRVIVFGGSDSARGVRYASAEIYDPANDVWSAAPDMPIATDGLSSVRLADGQIVVIAGRQLEVYNPAGVPGGSLRPRLPVQLPEFSTGVFSTWLLFAALAMVLGLGLTLAARGRSGWSPARGLGSAGLQVGGVVLTAVLLLIVAGKDVSYAPVPGSGQPAEYWFLTRPVGQEVIDASLLSLQLMAIAVAWSSIAGLAGAIWVTSWRRRRVLWLDLFAALIWIAPTFLIAILVQEIQADIAGHTGLVIAAGFGAVNPVQVTWAAIVLGIRPTAYFYRHGRSVLDREGNLDYARTAESKGLNWSRVVRRHLLRAGGSSLISAWLNSFRLMIGSLALVEYFFGYPGLGRVLVLSLGVPQGGRVSVHPDLALGLVLVLAAILVAAEQSAGWLRLRLDPRLREPVVVR